MEERESSERKSFLIKVILIIILLLLSFMASILYIYLYPKTTVILYDMDYQPISTFEVKRYSKLTNLPSMEKAGYNFVGWTYDDFNGEPVDPTREEDRETVKLYANYEAKWFKVTYVMQEYNAEDETYDDITNLPGCINRQYEFGTSFFLPTGRDNFQELYPEFQDRPGMHFAGWTTKRISEDDPNLDKFWYRPGAEFVVDIASDITFHAFFKKDEYKVNLHTGIYYPDANKDGNPDRDENGEYIIQNIPTENDPSNEKNSVIVDDIKYLDNVTLLTDQYANISLDAKNAGMAYGEYDFLGWYLDPDYKFAVSNCLANVAIHDGVPSYCYIDNGTKKYIQADLVGYDAENDDKPIYEFHLYSKWQRRSYTVNFLKNSNASNGKIEPIKLYRVFLDEETNTVIDEYGAYYDEGHFTYSGYESGKHYARVDLSTTDVVSEAFRNSNPNYRLIAWSNVKNSNSNQNAVRYANWFQDPWTEELGKSPNRMTPMAVYQNPVYIHSESNDKTLYACWTALVTIKFSYASGSNQKYFTYQGIEGEWFFLPDMKTIKDKTGEEWTKQHNYFAGWQTGTTSLATKYEEKLADGSQNPRFMYEIKRTSTGTVSLIVLWKKTPYTINFYKNDGTQSLVTTYYPVYGGNPMYFPSAPTRPGYIFDGWSKTKYQDNGYALLRKDLIATNGQITDEQTVNSASTTVVGDVDYYASWTIDYTIKYDANGGEFSGTSATSLSYSALCKKATSSYLDLKVNLSIGSGIVVNREYFKLVGWTVKVGDSEVSEDVIKDKASTATTLDFYEGKYYPRKNVGVIIPDSDKHDFFVDSTNTVTFVAKWEALKYKITIKDLEASSEESKTRVDYVGFDERYTFPTTNSLGVPYDTKIGKKLIGFSLSIEGTNMLLYNPENMPTIEPFTIQTTNGVTYYLIYQDMKVNVEYRFIKYIGGEQTEVKYVPTDIGVTVGEVDYGATITKLPTVTSSDYGDNKYVFKYWYYLDKNNEEVIVERGSRINYHNDEGYLIIYAKFEIEQYIIKLSITNPFKNNNVITTDTILSIAVEKDITIDSALYEEVMTMVYQVLGENIPDKVLSDGILKGYTLQGLFAIGGNSKKWEVGSKVSASEFTILAMVSDNTMTLETKWIASNIQLVYAKDLEETETKIETVTFTSPVTLKTDSAFSYEGGLQINKWFIVDPTDDNPVTNRLFFNCGSLLVGGNGTFDKLEKLDKYIAWDSETGIGTLKLFANCEQVCVVNYYVFKNGGMQKYQTVNFVYGSDMPALPTASDVNFNDLQFAGWYYKGTFVESIPVSEGNYNIDLYADFTFKIEYRLVTLSGNQFNYETLTTEYVNILVYDEETETYSYLNVAKITTCPELTSDQIPEGYEYYGLEYNGNIYNKDKITSEGVEVQIDGNNFVLSTYYTKDYTVTYQLNNAMEETFGDGTTESKIKTYTVGYDKAVILFEGNKINNITINESARKSAYVFVGWKIYNGENNLSETTYIYDAVINLTADNTILVPYFVSPEIGTIDVKISLYRELGTELAPINAVKADSSSYKNGDIYTFVDNNDESINWFEGTKEIYAWEDESGNVYPVGEVFNIPEAVEANQEFKFYAKWVNIVVVKFDHPDGYKGAINSPANVTLQVVNEKYTIPSDPTIDVTGITFRYWTYDAGSEIVEIYAGDTIRIVNATEYSFTGNSDGSIQHNIPAPTGNEKIITLMGVWTSSEYTISMYITNYNNTALDTTLTPESTPITMSVQFGQSFSARDILTQAVLDKETDQYGIIGWSTTLGGVVDTTVLQNISSNLVLYSVWQTKVEIKFAPATAEYGYEDAIETAYYLPGDKLDILNNAVKSIYREGYTTVYYEDVTAKTLNAGSNDYYQVVAFDTSYGVKIGINGNNFAEFVVPTGTSSITLTPVFGRTYRVSFFDNTTAEGGNEVVENVRYGRNGTSFNISQSNSEFAIARDKFSFAGWSTEKDAESGTNDPLVIGEANVKLYAVWTSNRKANFVLVTNNSGVNTDNSIFDMPFTKTNKIAKDLLLSWLNVENTKFTPNTALTALGHPVYTYNLKNFYLNGYEIITNGMAMQYDIDELCEIDFSDAIYGDGNVRIALVVSKVYTVTYTISNSSNVTGDAPNADYFVASSETFSGKLVAIDGVNPTGIIEFKLPVPNVTKPDCEPYTWSTDSSSQQGSSATTYLIENEDAMTLTYQELEEISEKLDEAGTNIYNLYLIWEYANIDIYVYALANIVDDNYWDTTLVDPYSTFANASDTNSDGVIDYQDIEFQNISAFLYNEKGEAIYAHGNFEFNNGKTAELRYGSKFSVRFPTETNRVSDTINGYRLIGFSLKLERLGETLDTEEFFSLREQITIDDTTVIASAIRLYPVYELVNTEVTVISNQPGATFAIGSTQATTGLLAAPIIYPETSVSTTGQKIYLNRFTIVTVTAGTLANSAYEFSDFNGLGFNSDTNVRTICGACEMHLCTNPDHPDHTEGQHTHFNYVQVVYTEKLISVKAVLEYEVPLTTEFSESGIVRVGGNDFHGYEFGFPLKYDSVETDSKVLGYNDYVTYRVENPSTYYEYVIMSGDKILNLREGQYIDISTLELSTTKNIDGHYTAEIKILARPISYNVTFIMSKGAFNPGTTLKASASIFDIDTDTQTFAINENIAYVYIGTTIILPTNEDLTYINGGAFEYFYLNTDSTKTPVTSKQINANTTFVEQFNDLAYSIQYAYGMSNGSLNSIVYNHTGIPVSTTLKIGEILGDARYVNGYNLEHWTNELGEKVFNDNQEVTLDRSYILIAKYKGSDVSIVYKYTGNLDGEVKVVENGKDFKLLTEEELDQSLVNTPENSYIISWKYTYNDNGLDKTISFNAGDRISFADLIGFTYTNGVQVILEAEYAKMITYNMEYMVTEEDTANYQDFDSESGNHYLRMLPDGTYNPNGLNYVISRLVPISTDSENKQFARYIVKYSLDPTFATYTQLTDDESNPAYISGEVLTIVRPEDIDGFDMENPQVIYYRFEPIYTGLNASEVKYIITNPNDDSVLKNDLTIFVNTIKTNLNDSYLPQPDLTTANKGKVTWRISQGTVNSFDLTIANFDWNKYTLVGYTLTAYKDAGTEASSILETRTLTIGDESNRNIAGAFRYELQTIWARNKTVYYFDNNNNEITELREYHLANVEKTIIVAKSSLDTSTYSLERDGYSFVGFVTEKGKQITANSDFYKFEQEFDLTVNTENSDSYDFKLYPANSYIYTIKFITTGVDSADESQFVFSTEFAYPKMFIGINDTNTIDMSNYVASVIYSQAYTDKYNFLGFAESVSAEAKSEFTFNASNISGSEMSVYVVWQKKSYKVTFEYNAIDGAGTNVADYYSREDIKYYGDNYQLYLGTNVANNNVQTDITAILTDYDYFTFVGFSFKNPDGTTTLLKPTDTIKYYTENIENIVITVEFAPVYRLNYMLPAGAIHSDINDGEAVTNDTLLGEEEILTIGETYQSKYLDEITWPGRTIKYWYANRVDGTTENFFDANGERELTADDLSRTTYVFTTDYRLRLNLLSDDSFTVNLYYIDSISKLLDYNESAKDETARAENYTLLTSVNALYGQSIYINANNDTLFDEYLLANPVTVTLSSGSKQVNTITDLANVYAQDQYVSNGQVTVNNGTDVFGMLYMNYYFSSIYVVQNYDGTNVNNLYLVYSPVKHKVYVQTLAVLENEPGVFTYDKDSADNSTTIAEYAVTANQVNDNGQDNVPTKDRRLFASAYKEGETFGYTTLDFTDNLYLFDIDKFVRANAFTNNKGYTFKGWKVLNVADKSIMDLSSSCTVSTSSDYTTISNITKDLVFVAIFVEETLDVTIKIYSTDNNGHNLDINLAIAGQPKNHTTVADETNKCAIINLKAKYAVNMTISSITPQENELYARYKIAYMDTGFGKYGLEPFNIFINEELVRQNSGKIEIEIHYDTNKSEVYMAIQQIVDGVNYSGELKYLKGEYGIYPVTTPTKDKTISYTTEDGKKANLKMDKVTQMPYGTIITNNFANPTMNNYEFAYWQYYNEDTGRFVNLSGESQVTANKTIYLRAVFAPKEVKVVYRVETTPGIYATISGIENTVANYGESFTLPTVVIENESFVTIGWSYNGKDYKWGDKVVLSSIDNVELGIHEGDATDQTKRLLIEITATKATKYKANFVAGKSSFNLSNYQNLNISIAGAKINLQNATYYHIEMTGNMAIITPTKYTNKNLTVENSFNIPDLEITSSDGAQFTGFVTNSQNSYAKGDKYTFNENDIGTNNTITFTAITNNYLEVRLYITNPTKLSETLNLSERANASKDLEYIKLTLDKTQVDMYVTLNVENSTDAIATFDRISKNGDIKSYFVNNTIGAEKLSVNYKLHGFATNRNTSYVTPVSGQIDYVARVTLSNDAAILQSLQRIIKQALEAGNTAPLELYSIWETKTLVEFRTDDDELVTSGYYGVGDTIVAPNPTTHTIENENRKWLGWQYTERNENRYFVNNELSFAHDGIAKVYTPIWETGYALRLNVNFDSQRVLFADTMSKFARDTNITLIQNSTGYPQFASTALIGKNESKVTNNAGEYFKEYTLGTLWTEEETFDIREIKKLKDENIYPLSLTFTDSTIKVSNSYFKLKGWSTSPTNADGSIFYSLEDIDLLGNSCKLSDLNNGEFGSVTLYAIWEDNSSYYVNFYATEVDAQNARNAIPQRIPSSDEYRIKYDFGSTFKLSDIGNSKDNLFKVPHKRFDKWVSYPNSLLEMSNTLTVVNNIYLYPTYIDEYTIDLRSPNGVSFDSQYGENGEDNRKTLIDGETINIISYIKETLGIDNLNIVQDIYYIDNLSTPISIKDKLSITFQKNGFKLDGHQIPIYIQISAKVNLFVPVKDNGSVQSANGFEQYGSPVEIDLGYTITVESSGILKNEFVFNTNTYYTGVNVAPVIEGWYLDKNDAITLDSLNNIEQFSIISKNADGIGGYSLRYMCDGVTYENPLTVGSQGLIINLYAKLTINYSIQVGDDNDIDAADFAKLTATAPSDNVSIESSDIITGLDAEGKEEQWYKKIVYKTIFGASGLPEFTIKTEGYVISSIDGLAGFEDVEETNDELVGFSKDNLNDNPSYSYATLIKTSEVTEKMLLTYTLRLNNIRHGNLKLIVNIKVFRFNTSITYDSSVSKLQYRSSNNASETLNNYRETTEVQTIQLLNSRSIYLDGYKTNYIYVSWVRSIRGNQVTLTYTDLPYGVELFITPSPINNLEYHFVEWETDNSNIISEETRLTYYPIDNASNKFEKDYEVKAIFARNQISDFRLILTIDDSEVKGTIWEPIIKEAKWGNMQIIVSSSQISRYSYTLYNDSDRGRHEIIWTIRQYNNSDEIVEAGYTNVLNKLNAWTNEYHNEFDKKIETQTVTEIATLQTLLRYFMLDEDGQRTWTSGPGVLAQKAEDHYVIYANHNGTVDMYANLVRAQIVEISDETVDYTNGQTIDGIDRAKVSLENYSELQGTQSLQNNAYVFVNKDYTTAVDYNTTKTYENIIVKMPYGLSIKAKVHPMDATSEHVSYTINAWKFETGGDLSSDSTITINSVNMIDKNSGFGTLFSIPEWKLKAQVVADTYDIVFNGFVTTNNETSVTIPVAYDLEIANLGRKHYAVTLGFLYDLASNESGLYAPRFVLQKDTSSAITQTLFCHTIDKDIMSSVNMYDYGAYQKIFKCWNNNNQEKGIGIVLEKYSSNEYSDIELTADYYSADTITIRMYDNSGTIDRVFYQIDANKKDTFGCSYSNTFDTDYIKKLVIDKFGEEFNNNPEFYLKGTTNKYHQVVCSLDEMKSYYVNSKTLAERNGYIIYPKILMTLNIDHNESETDSRKEQVVVETLGGRVILKMNMVEIADENIFEGYLQLDNVITDKDYIYIAYTTGTQVAPYNFAYWNVENKAIYQDEEFVANRLVYTNYVKVNAHYNGNFVVVDPSKRGDINIAGSELSESTVDTGAWTRIYAQTPSMKYITYRDTDIAIKQHIILKYAEIKVIESGFTQSTLEMQLLDENGTLSSILYTYKFVPKRTSDKFIQWHISTAKGQSQYLQKAGEYFTLDDTYGYINIRPVSFPDDVNISLAGFVITNLEGQYEDAYQFSYTNTFKVYGGTEFEVIDQIDKYGDSGVIRFNAPEGRESANYNNLVASVDTEKSELKDNLINFRWQYFDSNNNIWADMGDIFYADFISDDDKLLRIRLACEWINVKITFARIADRNIPEGTEYRGYTLDFASKCTNYTLINTFDNKKNNLIEITLFKSEVLKYDFDTRTFMVETNIRGRNKNTIDISLDTTKYYVQGWMQDISILDGLFENKEYSDMTPRTFVAWVEPLKTIQVNVDTITTNPIKGNSVVAGYGDVKYSVANVLGRDTINDSKLEIDIDNRTYGTVHLPLSAKMTLNATPRNDVKHQFSSMLYTGTTYVESSNFNKIVVNDILPKVLISFDASSTRSVYYVADMDNTLILGQDGGMDIYGGYQINTYVTSRANGDMETIDVGISNFWNKQVYRFKIHCLSNGKSDANNYYPREDYYIDNVMLYMPTTISINNKNVITYSEDKKSNIGQLSKIQYQGNYITNDTSSNTKFIAVYSEYVHHVTLNYEIYTYLGSQLKQSSKVLDGTLANIYDASGKAITSSRFAVAKDNRQFVTRYNIEKSGNELDVSDAFKGVIKPNKAYRLQSTYIYTGDYDSNDANGKATNYPGISDINNTLANTGNERLYSIERTTYTLRINLYERENTVVSLKFTLPQDENNSDLRNLYIKNDIPSGGRIEGTPAFNTGTYTLILPRYTSVYTSIENNRYVLTFINQGSSLGSISYAINSGYSPINKAESYGWYIDSEDGYLNSDIIKKNLSYESSSNATVLQDSYDYITFSDKAEPVVKYSAGIKYTSIDPDCTLVLALTRNAKYVYVDNQYWNNNYSKVRTEADEIKVLKDVFNTGFSSNVKTYIAPAGLFTLKFLDRNNKYIYGAEYTTSNTSYMYQDKNQIPVSIDKSNRFGFINYVGNTNTTVITQANGTTTTLSAGNGKDNSFAIVPAKVDVPFDLELTRSDEWALIGTSYGNYKLLEEAGSSTNHSIDNSKNITFMSMPKSSAGTTENPVSQGTFVFHKSDTINFGSALSPVARENRTSEIFTIGKNKASRLYQFGRQDYLNKSLTVSTNLQPSNDTTESVLLLTKYAWYSGNNLLGQGTTLELSSITQTDITIYPVFEYVAVHTVTLENHKNALSLNGGYSDYVVEGGSYDWYMGLDSISIGGRSINTVLDPHDSDIALFSITVTGNATVSGENPVKVIRSTGSGYESGSSSVNLYNIYGDVTLTCDWDWTGYYVEYICTGDDTGGNYCSDGTSAGSKFYSYNEEYYFDEDFAVNGVGLDSDVWSASNAGYNGSTQYFYVSHSCQWEVVPNTAHDVSEPNGCTTTYWHYGNKSICTICGAEDENLISSTSETNHTWGDITYSGSRMEPVHPSVGMLTVAHTKTQSCTECGETQELGEELCTPGQKDETPTFGGVSYHIYYIYCSYCHSSCSVEMENCSWELTPGANCKEYSKENCLVCGQNNEDHEKVQGPHEVQPLTPVYYNGNDQHYSDNGCIHCGAWYSGNSGGEYDNLEDCSYSVTTEPTYDAPGEETCSVCKNSRPLNQLVRPGCVHSNTYVQEKQPTCTEDGYYVVCCRDCGATNLPGTDYWNYRKTGHSYQEKLISVYSANCANPGVPNSATWGNVCAKCGNVENEWTDPVETLPGAYDHAWDSGTPISSTQILFTCIHCGATETETISAPADTPHSHSHAYRTETVNGIEYSIQYCSTCGEELSRHENVWMTQSGLPPIYL